MAENILVVDGEDAIHEIISSMLSSAGYQCRRVRNGLQAMALLDSGTQVDVILSEIMMPVMDGFALLIAVKQKYPHTPLAFVTSVRDRGVVDASINTGVCDYLIKPFNRDQLLTTVRRALSARSNPINERQLWARVVNEIDTATQTSGNKKQLLEKPKVDAIPLPEVDYSDDWSDESDTQELEGRLDEVEKRLDEDDPNGRSETTGATIGYSIGMTLAMILSWSSNGSVLYCLLHGLLSWFYVIYWVVVHRFLS
jgi:CheY-like chemotaxis protein